MQIINPFDPSAVPGGTIVTNLVNRCAVLYLINESNIGLKLLFPDGSTGVLPPWFARAWKLSNPNGPIAWFQLYTLGSTNPPISVVQGEGYEPIEADAAQLAQGPLSRQVNIGNTIAVTSGSGTTVTNIVNNTSVVGTAIIESTPFGDPSSTVILKNDATLTLGNNLHPGSIISDNTKFKSNGAGVLTTQNSTIQGNLTNSSNFTFNGTVNFPHKASFFSVTMTSTSMTVNHNFGSTPSWVGITPTSSTLMGFYGVSSFTSTTATIQVSSATGSPTFIGVALG